MKRILSTVSKAIEVGTLITVGDIHLRVETIKNGSIDTISVARKSEG